MLTPPLPEVPLDEVLPPVPVRAPPVPAELVTTASSLHDAIVMTPATRDMPKTKLPFRLVRAICFSSEKITLAAATHSMGRYCCKSVPLNYSHNAAVGEASAPLS